MLVDLQTVNVLQRFAGWLRDWSIEIQSCSHNWPPVKRLNSVILCLSDFHDQTKLHVVLFQLANKCTCYTVLCLNVHQVCWFPRFSVFNMMECLFGCNVRNGHELEITESSMTTIPTMTDTGRIEFHFLCHFSSPLPTTQTLSNGGAWHKLEVCRHQCTIIVNVCVSAFTDFNRTPGNTAPCLIVLLYWASLYMKNFCIIWHCEILFCLLEALLWWGKNVYYSNTEV